jgi:pimeloyl-ACP methyl ester carboxylesterase
MNLAALTPAEFVAALDRAATRHATSNGSGEVVWRVWGAGPPLVLLHGGTGSWMHWVRNVEHLSRDFMVIAPDTPGSGESATPAPPLSVERIAASLHDGLGTIIGADTDFTLVGFSMGGLIAGYVAQLARRRAQCLVLVGSAGMEATAGIREPLQSWRRLATDQEKREIHRRNLGILMIHDPRKIDDLAVYIQSQNAGRSRVRGKHLAQPMALSHCLPGYQGRLAGIWGEHDATSAPYLAEREQRLRQFQPAATFDIVHGAGHWVQYEAPDEFNRLLRTLVNQGPSVPAPLP